MYWPRSDLRRGRWRVPDLDFLLKRHFEGLTARDEAWTHAALAAKHANRLAKPQPLELA